MMVLSEKIPTSACHKLLSAKATHTGNYHIQNYFIYVKEVYETVSFSFSQAQQVDEMTRTLVVVIPTNTVSKLRQVLHTDSSQPSPSLISSNCYPESHKCMPVACKYVNMVVNMKTLQVMSYMGRTMISSLLSSQVLFCIHLWCYAQWNCKLLLP